MQSVRVQPGLRGGAFVDVTCDCGANCLADKELGHKSVKHFVGPCAQKAITLICDAYQSEFVINFHGSHVHVSNQPSPTDGRVLFYEVSRYFFSNFSSFMVRWGGIDWMTSEHLYQAAKFNDPEIVEEIRRATSAHDAKKIAQAHCDKRAPGWSVPKKLAVMEEILRAKLAQHPYIRRKLLETGNREIVENSPTDSFWGRGPDWQGENWLGKLWMKLRAELQGTSATSQQ